MRLATRYTPLFPRPAFPMQPRRWLTSAHTLAVWVREDLVSLAGVAVANEIGLTALIWHGVPSDLNANPFEVITGVTTDGVGHTDFQLSATGLALFDPITFLLVKAGSPDRYGVRTIIPSYE